jgi:enoyl-CoA hydratase/carnithine racemase
MLDAREAATAAAAASVGVRAMILSGSGASFSAGGDIRAWAGLDPQSFAYQWVRRGHRTFDRLARLRFPTIAVLNGDTLGGGLELAAACDFRIAEAHVRIGLPEAGLGMVPGWSGTQRMARRFGTQIVRRMAIGGELLDAETACRAGVVDQVAGTGKGMDAAIAYADAVAKRGGAAVQAVKLMLAVAEGEAADAAIEMLSSAMIATTDDLREGVAAFQEKRSPDFSRRKD